MNIMESVITEDELATYQNLLEFLPENGTSIQVLCYLSRPDIFPIRNYTIYTGRVIRSTPDNIDLNPQGATNIVVEDGEEIFNGVARVDAFGRLRLPPVWNYNTYWKLLPPSPPTMTTPVREPPPRDYAAESPLGTRPREDVSSIEKRPFERKRLYVRPSGLFPRNVAQVAGKKTKKSRKTKKSKKTKRRKN